MELPVKPDHPLTTSSQPAEALGPPGEQPSSAANVFPLRFSKKPVALAFAIAALSDAVGAFVTLTPPIMWAVDAVTAVLLFVVLGWHWLLLPGLVMEAIPGVGVLPFWLLVVGAIAVWGTARPKLKWPEQNQGDRTLP
jgi:hypothetical protein